MFPLKSQFSQLNIIAELIFFRICFIAITLGLKENFSVACAPAEEMYTATALLVILCLGNVLCVGNERNGRISRKRWQVKINSICKISEPSYGETEAPKAVTTRKRQKQQPPNSDAEESEEKGIF